MHDDNCCPRGSVHTATWSRCLVFSDAAMRCAGKYDHMAIKYGYSVLDGPTSSAPAEVSGEKHPALTSLAESMAARPRWTHAHSVECYASYGVFSGAAPGRCTLRPTRTSRAVRYTLRLRRSDLNRQRSHTACNSPCTGVLYGVQV